MVNILCPIDGCTYQTRENPATVVVALLSLHSQGVHKPPAAPQARARAPKIDRRTLSDDTDEETWNVFKLGWDIYAKAHVIPNDKIAVQLYQCCSATLKQKITWVYNDFLVQPVDRLLPLLKTLTVTPVAVSVKRNEFLQLKQDAGETFWGFHSRMKSKAVTCRFKVRCNHPRAPADDGVPIENIKVDYTNEMIRHVVLNGIYNEEIKRDIFGDGRIDIMER